MAAVVGAMTIALFGRDVEERTGSGTFLGGVLCAAGILAAGVFGLQATWHWFGFDAGWGVPLIGYPTVTALVAYRVVQSPLGRLNITGYQCRTWVVAAGYVASNMALLLHQSWPIQLPGHLMAIVYGTGVAVVTQRKRRFIDPTMPTEPSVGGATTQSAATLSDDELEHRLDEILAKIAVRGMDSLPANDRAVLQEAARRRNAALPTNEQ